jgi:hypothetical protein
MPKCWNGHGEYDGHECPTCAQIDATKRAGEMVAKATREAADREERSAQHRAEQSAHAHQEALHAQYGTQAAIHRAAEQNELLARDGWKLQVESKVQRALELLNNDMFAESSSILRDALATDPGNLFVHLYLAVGERSSGKPKEYWVHLQKAIQLLGTTDYSTVVPYSETMKVFLVQAPNDETGEFRGLRELLFKKLRAFLQNQPSDIDIQFLDTTIDRGWDEIARLSVDAIDPGQLSLKYVQTSLDHECYDTAAFIAQRIVEVAAARIDPSTWLQGALTMWQIKHRVNRGTPEKSVRLLARWNIEQVADVLDNSLLIEIRSSDPFRRLHGYPLASRFGLITEKLEPRSMNTLIKPLAQGVSPRKRRALAWVLRSAAGRSWCSSRFLVFSMWCRLSHLSSL